MNELHTIDSEALITELRQKVNRRLLQIARSYEDPQSLYRPIEYVLNGGGKRIRPILTLLANHAFHGSEQAALNAAVSLEMLHNFTLVHDDIMDEDYQRRGQPTVHTKWDVSTAILSGDNLLALAYKVLLMVRSDNLHQILDIYTDGLIDICEGQAYDKEFESRSDVSLNEYLVMIRKKTGRLISLSCKIGGLVAEAPASDLEALEQFGVALGKAFQVQDDLLELTSTMDVMGKSLGSDFFAQKKTFVLLKALELADDETHQLILDILENSERSNTDFEQLKSVLYTTGVIEKTQQYVEAEIQKAHDSLAQLDADISHLQYLTNQLLTRKS